MKTVNEEERMLDVIIILKNGRELKNNFHAVAPDARIKLFRLKTPSRDASNYGQVCNT